MSPSEPSLSWNEIRQCAIAFSHKSKGDTDERAEAEECAQDPRESYLDNGATLADLYAPLYMPASLLKAHQNLVRAVDRCYCKDKIETERASVEFLFELYEEKTRGTGR